MRLEAQQFERIALDELDTVYRVARRLARDPNSAEDLVQETYLRALRAKETFDLQAHGIRPWLLRILHNLHLTRAEREGRQPRAVEEEYLDLAEAPGGVATALAPLNYDYMDEQLVQAIESLAADYRQVLLLWAVDDLAYKDIAEVLDIPLGTVMSRLHRARQKLTEQLHDYAMAERIIRE